MGTVVTALIRVIIGILVINWFTELVSNLEKKLDESFGWRTDLLVTSSIVVTWILAMFIFYNFFALIQPIFTALFIK